MQQRTFVPGVPVAGPTRSPLLRFAVGATALMAAVLLTGCGSKAEKAPEATAQVSGAVTVMGRALPSGTITLLSSGMSWQAKLDRAGKFKLADSVPPGEYLVYLRADDGGAHPYVPVKFQSDTSTDYKVSVKTGNNDLTINLK